SSAGPDHAGAASRISSSPATRAAPTSPPRRIRGRTRADPLADPCRPIPAFPSISHPRKHGGPITGPPWITRRESASEAVAHDHLHVARRLPDGAFAEIWHANARGPFVARVH